MATQLVEAPGALDFQEVRLSRDYVISRDGKDYVLAAGLITGLHQLSGGYFDVETRLEQLPTEANGMLAVCSARVTVFAPDDSGRVLRAATGLGDASPQSVGRMMLPHLVRMAETRAQSRALRTLLNVAGMVAFEELGPSEAERRTEEQPERETRAPAAPVSSPQVEGIVIEGKRYTRPQVEGAWRTRRAEAERLGIALPSDVATLVAEQAPLNILVGATQQLRKLVEATQAGQR